MNVVQIRIIVLCLSLAFSSVLFTGSGKADIDPDSIMGLWLFDEGKGNEVEDSTGNGYDGDMEGVFAWIDGVYGSALEFKEGDYVELQESAANLAFGGTEPFTITAWVMNGGGGTIVGKYNGGVIGAYVFTIGGGGAIGFHREVAPWSFSGTKALRHGEFGHAAVTYDGKTMSIYVDGELDSEQDRPGQNTDTATPVLIGARYTGGNPSNFFRGALDEVAIFNVALTEEQIQEVMKGLAAPEAVSVSGKLVFTWGAIKAVF